MSPTAKLLRERHSKRIFDDRQPITLAELARFLDGTARIQTVREETNPMLYRLLKEFDALTGVPVLINTSYNIKGEPIVETPRDAVACFLTTGVDHLIMHDTVVSKTAMHRIVGPLVDTYTDVANLVSANTRPA